MGRIKNLLRNINYLSKHSLWDQREEDIVFLTNKILQDGMYEYDIDVEGIYKPNILNSEESLTLLEKFPKSFIRTGDGECKIMKGMDQPFQKYEKEIADSLKKSLSVYREDMYVGVNRNYFIPLCNGKSPAPAFYMRNAFEFRQIYANYLNPEITYLDATFTSYPLGSERSEKLDKYFERWKNLFKNKDVVIICGKGILDKLEYDIFELANRKKIIEGPSRHAWEERENLVSRIHNETNTEELLVFILGMAGKAMIPNLTDEGYMCWDVGHLAKYYDSYMKGVKGTKENVANFFAPD